MRKALVIGGLLLAAAVWIGGTTRLEPRAEPSGPGGGAAVVVGAPAAPSKRRTGPPHLVRAAAVRFLGAFVHYEVGAPRRRWLRSLRQAATPSLARGLERRPPRVPAGTTAARVGEVVSGRRRRRVATALAALDRGATRSTITLVLVRKSSRWLVAELRR